MGPFDLADLAPEIQPIEFGRLSHERGGRPRSGYSIKLLEILLDEERHALREFLPMDWDGDDAVRVVTSKALGRLVAAGLVRKATPQLWQLTPKGRLAAPELIKHAKFKEDCPWLVGNT
jgi:hypothetical protein